MSVDRSLPKTSESLQGKSDLYWYKYFEEDDVLFFKINNFYSNTQPDITEEEKKTWQNVFDFQKEIVKEIKTTNPYKIVIDLVVLTGKRTLSAGIIFEWQLQNDLGATIIGAKTGVNINSFGTVDNYINLPNSNLFIACSYYSYFEAGAKYKDGVKSDIEIIQR